MRGFQSPAPNTWGTVNKFAFSRRDVRRKPDPAGRILGRIRSNLAGRTPRSSRPGSRQKAAADYSIYNGFPGRGLSPFQFAKTGSGNSNRGAVQANGGRPRHRQLSAGTRWWVENYAIVVEYHRGPNVGQCPRFNGFSFTEQSKNLPPENSRGFLCGLPTGARVVHRPAIGWAGGRALTY